MHIIQKKPFELSSAPTIDNEPPPVLVPLTRPTNNTRPSLATPPLPSFLGGQSMLSGTVGKEKVGRVSCRALTTLRLTREASGQTTCQPKKYHHLSPTTANLLEEGGGVN